jgi:hypothetical protein
MEEGASAKPQATATGMGEKNVGGRSPHIAHSSLAAQFHAIRERTAPPR